MFIEDMHGKSIGNPHPIYIYIYIYIYILLGLFKPKLNLVSK
jgi:hypothetical protein